MRILAVPICCLLLICCPAFAQSSRGTITGTIVDPANAVIPGATIEAKNSETGAVYNAGSSASGNYTLNELPVGMYQLSAAVPGFKQYVRTGITVLAAQVLRVDIKLEVGNIAETITVNGDAPLLKTESGELSHNVSTDRMNDLPVMGFAQAIRDPYAVINLMPGTSTGGGIRVNGAPGSTQALRIEGQDSTMGQMVGIPGFSQPSVDAIEEFAVQTSNYAAEYGQAGGGNFVVTMKSGTNRYHGSAYDYWVNEALNASVPFQNVKPRERRNDYGFTFSGPVWIPKLYDGHDKTFFFFNFEQYRRTTVNNASPQTVPTLAYRNGDFRQAITGKNLCGADNPSTPQDESKCDPLGHSIIEGTIYDPLTERIVNGQRVRDPFLNNTIPSDRFDPVAVKIQNLIPTPTNSNLTLNYLVPWAMPKTYTIPSVKVDHNFGSRSKLSVYWSSTSQFSLAGINDDGIFTPATSRQGSDIDGFTTRVNYELTLRPTLLLHLGAGVQDNTSDDHANITDYDQYKELGLKGAGTTRFPLIMGLLSTTTGGKGQMGASAQVVSKMLKPTANASLSWVKQNHTYKFGSEMRIEGYPAHIRNTSRGQYNFTANQTGLPSTQGQILQGGTVGFPYASFLLGAVDNGNIGVESPIRAGKSSWALYFQDSWKVTRKFTLDYGLRWDYQGYEKEQYGRFPSFSPTTANPSIGGRPGAFVFEGSWPGHCNCDFAKVYPYSFGPRLGAAYQLSPKTVLRAGIGVMYSQTQADNALSSGNGIASNNPFATPTFGNAAIYLKDGPPAPGAWPNLDPGQYPAFGQITVPPTSFDGNSGRPARMIQWSLSVQREIFKNLAVEIAYIGNRGVWWEGNNLIDVNALTPERIASFGLDISKSADRDLLNAQLNSSLAAQRGFNRAPYASFPLGSTVAQSLRPYPQFGKMSYRWAPLGSTWYDSLQMKVTKRYSQGLDLSSGFTWQKELMMGAEQAGAPPWIVPAVNDVFNRPMNKYLSMYSRPVTFFLAVNYTLPAIRGNKALSWAVRDWKIGTVLQYASGLPIQVPAANNQLSTLLFRGTFVNRVPGQPLFTKDVNCNSCFDPEKDFVLNPAAWVDPPAGQFGASAAFYNDYRNRRKPSEALSIGRVFRIKEGVQFTLRADFQNIFNRTVLSDPTATNAQASQNRGLNGKPISGFGYINTATGTSPRQGIIVARIQF